MNAPKLIAHLMAVRTAAHLLHLQSRSYAQHKALEEFYEGLLELVDQYAEVYQGRAGLIASYPVVTPPKGSPEEVVGALDDLLAECAEECSTVRGQRDLSLENIVAEMQALTSRTFYKLRNLK